MKKPNRDLILLGSILAVLGVVCLCSSYAWYKFTNYGTKTVSIQSADIDLLIMDEQNAINLEKAYPISDTEGMALTPYTFTIKNTGFIPLNYTLRLVEDQDAMNACTGCKFIPSSSIRVEVTTPNGVIGPMPLTINGNTLDLGRIAPGTENQLSYQLKVWISSEAGEEARGAYYYGKVQVEGSQMTDIAFADTTGAAEPVLEQGMVPVKYNSTKGVWEKADRGNPVTNPWYNYADKQWANAVVVKETGTKSRAYYQTAEVGTEIPMDDILQMLVWIPRYKYVMPAAKEGQIDIIFENNTTAKSTGTATGTSYLTHPAFTFGKTELNGLWVGKFESSSDVACTTSTGAQGTNCDLTSIKPQIKPNVKSWTGARVSTFFTASRNVQAAGNPYGYRQSGMNTRMMKNSEWGAVAYLTQSKYGRCTDGVCTEVTMNNLNSGDGRTITGCAADTITASELRQADCPAANKYNTEKGVLASTTANVYGVYDMAGGDWEYVMGNYNKYSGYTAISYTVEQAKTILGRTDNIAVGVWNSGFNGPVYGKALDNTTALTWTTGIDFPEEKYYDLYTTTSASTSCNGNKCLGHALSETAGWYGDYQYHVSSASPWFYRGGGFYNGSSAGVFFFYSDYGRSHYVFTFRLVVSGE